MQKLSIDELRRELRWEDVVEEERRLEYSGSLPALQGRVTEFGILRIVPSNPDWPSILMVLDPSLRSPEQIEFANWDGYDVDFGDMIAGLEPAATTAAATPARAIDPNF